MKKIIAIVAIAATGFAACQSNKDTEKEALQQQVQDMKLEMAKKQAIDSVNEANKLQPVTVAPMPEQTVAVTPEPAAPVHKPKVVYKTRTVVKHEYAAAPVPVQSAPMAPVSANNTDQYAGYAQPQQAQTAPQAAYEKSGWSAKAKGSLIGAGVGALGGALLGKNRGTGALIGAGVGAAAGLGTGAVIDHRNGRNKNKDNNDNNDNINDNNR